MIRPMSSRTTYPLPLRLDNFDDFLCLVVSHGPPPVGALPPGHAARTLALSTVFYGSATTIPITITTRATCTVIAIFAHGNERHHVGRKTEAVALERQRQVVHKDRLNTRANPN